MKNKNTVIKKRYKNLSAEQLSDCYNVIASTLGWKQIIIN